MPAAIGIMAASDRSAMMALSETIERRFSIVGKVSRQQRREQQDQRRRQDRQAVDGQEPQQPVARREPAHFGGRRLERVGLDGVHAPPRRTRRGDQGLGGERRAGEVADDAAAVEHERPVAQMRHLLEVRRHDQDARGRAPARRRSAGRSRPWRRRRRPRSGPRRSAGAGRWRAIGRPRPSAGCRPTGPRSAGPGRSAAGPPRRRAGGRLRASRRGARGSEAAAHRGGVQEDVLADAERGRDALLGAVAGDEADAGRPAPRPARPRSARPVQHDVAGMRDGAEQRPADLFLPGAAQADQAQDLAVPQVEIDRAGRCGAQPATLSAPRPGPGGAHEGPPRSRPTMSPTSPSGVASAPPLAHEPPVAQHGDAVGDAEHLVQPVRHVDHADARRPQPPHGGEKPLHLVGGRLAVGSSRTRCRTPPPAHGRWRRAISRSGEALHPGGGVDVAAHQRQGRSAPAGPPSR